jgi:tetratricopeptide (TPR) repeat protein
MNRALLACAVCVTMSLLLSPAFAGESADDILAKAEAKAKADSLADAAEFYALAMKAAQKKKDLPAQERVQNSLRKAERDAQRKQRTPNARGSVTAAALHGLLAGLDPKRNSAFLSRGPVSYACILAATTSGDRTNLELACTAAIAHARIAKSGAYAQAMASYAQGLLHAEKQEHAKACPALQTALDRMGKEQWAWTGVIVATEAAAVYLAAGDPDKATAALETGAVLMKANGDRAVAQVWRTAVTERLAGAPANVLTPYDKAVTPLMGAGGFSGKGGAGGAGGKGGRGGSGAKSQSKVGAAWKKLSKKKPFITVKRTASGYEIKQGFDRGFKATQPYAKGVKHHADGGVTLSFWHGGVRLHMVDMEGRNGQPGEGSQPGSFTLFFPLAIGETWGVNKAGEVTFSSK